jgi:hypothetical protein
VYFCLRVAIDPDQQGGDHVLYVVSISYSILIYYSIDAMVLSMFGGNTSNASNLRPSSSALNKLVSVRSIKHSGNGLEL